MTSVASLHPVAQCYTNWFLTKLHEKRTTVHLQTDNDRIITVTFDTSQVSFFHFTLLPATAKTASLHNTKVNQLIKNDISIVTA
jgi:hypothetical protein